MVLKVETKLLVTCKVKIFVWLMNIEIVPFDLDEGYSIEIAKILVSFLTIKVNENLA